MSAAYAQRCDARIDEIRASNSSGYGAILTLTGDVVVRLGIATGWSVERIEVRALNSGEAWLSPSMKSRMAFFHCHENAAASCAHFSSCSQRSIDRCTIIADFDNMRRE